MARKKTQDEYESELKIATNGNIVVCEKYKGIKVSIKHYCKKHKVTFNARPENLLRGRGCEMCAEEKISNINRVDIKVIKDKLRKIHGDEFILLEDKYVNRTTPMRFEHRVKDGNIHKLHTTWAQLSSGGCAVCAGRQVAIGYNDIATTDPEVVKFFYNKEDAYKYTRCSEQRIDIICPDCNSVFDNKLIKDIVRYGFNCSKCGNGRRFPNKFFLNCLVQIEECLEYMEWEYSPEWCKYIINGKLSRGYYDFYIVINNQKYIIELDGGYGHGKRNTSKRTKEDTIYVDFEKEKLAKLHGFTVIRIDCDYDTLANRTEYIVDKIYKSKLNDILPLEKIDFQKAAGIASEKNIIKACDLWNEGYKVKDIAKKLYVKPQTIRTYLIEGTKLNLCENYSAAESKKRSNGKKVINLHTKKVYSTIVEAKLKTGISEDSIRYDCRQPYKAVCPIKDRAWMYYDEYIKSFI